MRVKGNRRCAYCLRILNRLMIAYLSLFGDYAIVGAVPEIADDTTRMYCWKCIGTGCYHCGQTLRNHVRLKCIFGSTEFEVAAGRYVRWERDEHLRKWKKRRK